MTLSFLDSIKVHYDVSALEKKTYQRIKLLLNFKKKKTAENLECYGTRTLPWELGLAGDKLHSHTPLITNA